MHTGQTHHWVVHWAVDLGRVHWAVDFGEGEGVKVGKGEGLLVAGTLGFSPSDDWVVSTATRMRPKRFRSQMHAFMSTTLPGKLLARL